MADFTQAVEAVLQREGGYSNRLEDHGGPTAFGISQRAFPDEHIATLTRERAIALYRERYWLPLFDRIAVQKVAEKLFDACVNLGPQPAVRLLQRALNEIGFTVIEDGQFGAQTLLALNLSCQKHTKALLDAWRARQSRYYVDIVLNDSTQLVFLDGWLKRAVV